MGIQNKEGALYFATGVDNTGLYAGRREAIGIIKSMASEVTSFDVFGGVGISAGIAFAQAAKGAYDFEKQFQQSMKEVATLSNGIKGSLTDFMNQVVGITREVPVKADDAAKALYQIVSAGHDGADGMRILEASAKAAIGGVTDTATAADAITTLINAYKLSAEDAGRVSDQLFTTVKLGKTNFSELGQSIAQAAPIAAAYGVEIEQVLAAAATLTKQGTPTAQAMTQIRAAIVGVSKHLGDGAYNGRTFQEALELVRQEAGGSEAKLREMIPEMEAVNGLLGLTGKNAQEAAGHLEEMGNSTGATKAAFEEMASSAQNQLQLLQNNITAALRPMGEAILKEVSDVASAFNEAFANGDVKKSMETLGALVVTVTGAFVGYKGSILAASAAKQIHASITALLNKQRTIEIGKLVLSQGFYDADSAAVIKNTSARVLLTKALRAQLVASVKATAAMLTNPYVLAAGAVAALGYGLYKLATAESEAEKAVRRHREERERFQKISDERKQRIEELIRVIQDETETEYAKVKAYDELQRLSPALTNAYKREELATLELAKSQKVLNEEREKMNYENIISNIEKYSEYINRLGKNGDKLRNVGNMYSGMVGEYGINTSWNERLELAKEDLKRWKGILDEYNRIKKQAEEDAKPVEVKLLEAQSSRDQIAQEYDAARIVLEQEQEKIKKSPFAVIPIDVQIRFNNAQNALKGINNTISGLQSQQNKTSNNETETYKQAYDKAKADWKAKIRALEDAKNGTKNEYENAKKAAEEAEKNYKNLGGITDGSASAALRQQQEKYNLLLDKQKLEQIRAEEDLQMQVSQSKIDTMSDGFNKEQAQRNLNNKKEIQSLERQKEDAIRAIIQAEKEKFDAQEDIKAQQRKGYVKQSFDTSTVDTSKAGSSWDKIIRNTETKQVLDEWQKREDSMNEYLLKYGTFSQKKEAIDKKYQDAINQETDIGSKNMLQKEWDEALSSLEMDKLKQEINWELIFGDLSKVSKKSLSEVKQQLKTFKSSSEYKDMSVDQKKVIDDALNDIQTTLIDKGGLLGDLPEQLDALRIAQKELNDAQEEYNDTIKHGTDAEKEAALKKKNNAEKNIQNAEVNVTKSADKTSQNLITLADTITGLGSTSEMSLSQIGSLASGLIDTFTDAGSKIGGIIGAAFSLLDVIDKQGIDGFVENVFSSVFKAAGSIWDTITFGAFSKITGSGESDKNLEQDIEYLTQSNQDLKNSLDNLSEKMDKASVADANDIYSIQRENILKQEANLREAMQRSGAAYSNGFWGIAGSHSSNNKIDKGLSTSEWSRISEIVGKSVSNAGQFFQLSSEQMAKLAEEDTTLYSKIKDLANNGYRDAAQYMDEYISYYKQLEELESAYNEKLTNTSFDSIRSDFKNALLDMESDAEDFAGNFEKMMQNAIVESLMTKKYDALIQGWYKEFAKAMEGDSKIDESEQKKLQDRWNSITNQALAERDALKDAMGWEIDKSSSQDSTKRGFGTEMTHEDAGELSGRFTALQISNDELKNQSIIQSGIQITILQRLEEIYRFSGESNSEYSDMMYAVIEHLEEIHKNTNSLPRMEKVLEDIKKYSASLAGK